MRFLHSGGYEIFKIWCAFRTYRTSQFSRSITNFKGSITITWLVAIVLDSAVWRQSRHKGGALRDMCISETEELKGANEGIDRNRRRIHRVQCFKIQRNYTYGNMGVCVAGKHHMLSFFNDLAHSTLTF